MIGTVLRHGMSMACILGVAYETRLGLEAIAGTTTTLNSNVIWRISASVAISASWGAISTYGWIRERRVRKQMVRDTTPYIAQLESRIDPSRQSSGLSVTGDAVVVKPSGTGTPGVEKP